MFFKRIENPAKVGVRVLQLWDRPHPSPFPPRPSASERILFKKNVLAVLPKVITAQLHEKSISAK
jgi:hypothetical protein